MSINPKEVAPSSKREMHIGIDMSPAGNSCIKMTFGDKEWILLRSMRAPLAGNLRKQLKEEFGVDSLPGVPFDWRVTLQTQELKIHDEEGVIGVYVDSSKYDDLVDRFH